MRDFPVTAVHAFVHDDGEQAGCVTFQSQSCMHLCTMVGNIQGARQNGENWENMQNRENGENWQNKENGQNGIYIIAVTTPCSASGLGPMCMTMVSLQLGSIVTVLVSEAVWMRHDDAHFSVSEQPLPGIMGTSLHGPAAHWSLCTSLPTCVPQNPAAGRPGARAMRVPRVVPHLWAAFSVHA